MYERRRTHAWLRALCALALAWLPLRQAYAGGCCFTASATSAARLASWENAVLGLSTSYQRELGYFSSTRQAIALGAGVNDQQARFDVYGLVRVHEEVTLSFVIPTSLVLRSASGIAATGGGLGDIQLGVRYEFLPFDEAGQVGLALLGGIGVPTGPSPASSRAALAVDATGRGTLFSSLGLSLEWASSPWFIRSDVVGSVPIPTLESGAWHWLSPTLELMLMGGVRVIPVLFVSALARFGVQFPTAVQAVGYDTGLGGSIAYKPDHQWTLIAHVSASLFATGAGMNRNASVNAGLTLRYALF